MRVIVLGPKGQLGSDVVRILTGRGIDVEEVSRDRVDAESINVEEQLSALPVGDVVVNCTAFVNVDAAESQAGRAMQVNSVFPALLARYCTKVGAKLIHISTDFVFDGRAGRAYVEDDVVSPINIYGLSKASGELAVRGSCPSSYILRVSALYGVAGSGSKGGNFVETMIRIGSEKGVIRVVDDQFTSPTHTLDVARVILSLVSSAENPAFGTYHCANIGLCSWFEFAKEIVRQSGVRADVLPISLSEFKMAAPRPVYSALQVSKLDQIFKMPTWQDSLEEYLRLKRST